jgi:hypothetical protein
VIRYDQFGRQVEDPSQPQQRPQPAPGAQASGGISRFGGNYAGRQLFTKLFGTPSGTAAAPATDASEGGAVAATSAAPTATAAATPEAAATGATAAAGGEGSAAAAAAPLYANPWVGLAALIVGTSVGLNHNHVSSFSNQFRGQAISDVIHSPNVQKDFLNDKIVKDIPNVGGFKSWRNIADLSNPMDMHDFARGIGDAAKAPIDKVSNALKGLFS